SARSSGGAKQLACRASYAVRMSARTRHQYHAGGGERSMLDVAVVGAGSRGATHLDTISRLADLYRLVGVCDAREDRRAWAATTYGVPVFDHPVALLERAKPQGVAAV